MEAPRLCPDCKAQVSPALKACPACGALVRREEIKTLVAQSSEAEASGDLRQALESCRLALDLLPENSRQWLALQARLRELSGRVEKEPPKPQARQASQPGHWKRWFNPKQWGAGLLGLLALAGKFKVLILAGLGKAKYLVLGLKGGLPLFSLLGSFGVYWTLHSWKFALGLIGAIYVHELGHLAALRRYGFQASAPMFIPGLGAFVRMGQHPATAIEDARVGLAGPAWGLFPTLLLAGLWLFTGQNLLGYLAQLSAWINVFNLLPIPPLDGGRALASLDSAERLACAAVSGGLAYALDSKLCAAIAFLMLLRSGSESTPLEGDRKGALALGLILAAHACLGHWIQVPQP